jgi:uncharacterized DUF497 family protein
VIGATHCRGREARLQTVAFPGPFGSDPHEPAASSLERPKFRSHKAGSLGSWTAAQTAFLDDNARVIADPEHSEDEERFVLLGLSISLRVLVVCHCYRQSDGVIRIISARKADQDEIEQYHWWLR